jgi:uncharacterized protein (TIGR00369 family)
MDSALGLGVSEVGSESARGWLDVDDRNVQALGMVHGGAYSILAERLAVEGARAHMVGSGEIALAGSSIDTSFLRPVFRGAHVSAEAVVRHRASHGELWDVTFSDGSGSTCAISRVELRLGVAGG